MTGEILHYGLDLLFTGAAVVLFLTLACLRKLDFSESPSETLFMEDADE